MLIMDIGFGCSKSILVAHNFDLRDIVLEARDDALYGCTFARIGDIMCSKKHLVIRCYNFCGDIAVITIVDGERASIGIGANDLAGYSSSECGGRQIVGRSGVDIFDILRYGLGSIDAGSTATADRGKVTGSLLK